MADDDNAQVEAQIERALDAGDLGGAAEAIVRRYGVEVMSYLVAVTRDRQAADDVFSTTCEDLWRGLAGFQRRSSVRTWLYRLAWHAMLRHRNDAFARRRAPLSRQLESWAAPIRSRTAAHLRTEMKDAVARLREQLDPEEQTLLVLRVDRGLSWREVGAIMSTSEDPLTEATLAKRFQRVKTKLRRLVEAANLLQPG